MASSIQSTQSTQPTQPPLASVLPPPPTDVLNQQTPHQEEQTPHQEDSTTLNSLKSFLQNFTIHTPDHCPQYHTTEHTTETTTTMSTMSSDISNETFNQVIDDCCVNNTTAATTLPPQSHANKDKESYDIPTPSRPSTPIVAFGLCPSPILKHISQQQTIIADNEDDDFFDYSKLPPTPGKEINFDNHSPSSEKENIGKLFLFF